MRCVIGRQGPFGLFNIKQYVVPQGAGFSELSVDSLFLRSAPVGLSLALNSFLPRSSTYPSSLPNHSSVKTPSLLPFWPS